MRNMLLALLGVAVLALGGYAAASTLDDTVPARTISLPGATTGETTTGETTLDTTTSGATTPGTTTNDDDADDLSGPCDEAEHANDPRCTGGTTTHDRDGHHDDDNDDNSGRGSGGNDGNDDDKDNDEDRSGSNSGRG